MTRLLTAAAVVAALSAAVPAASANEAAWPICIDTSGGTRDHCLYEIRDAIVAGEYCRITHTCG